MSGTRQSDLAGWDFSEIHLAGIKQNGQNAIALVNWSLQSVFIKGTPIHVWIACRNRNSLLAYKADAHVVSARVVEVLTLLNMLHSTDPYQLFENIFIGKRVFSPRQIAPSTIGNKLLCCEVGAVSVIIVMYTSKEVFHPEKRPVIN